MKAYCAPSQQHFNSRQWDRMTYQQCQHFPVSVPETLDPKWIHMWGLMSGKPHTSRFHRCLWSCRHPASASLHPGPWGATGAPCWEMLQSGCCAVSASWGHGLCAAPCLSHGPIQALPTNLLHCNVLAADPRWEMRVPVTCAC